VGAGWDVDAIRPIVHAWDEAVRADVPSYARLMPEAERRGSVLRSGASEEQIAEAENRLGMVLPASYRSFLRISSGAWAGAWGADYYTRTTPPTSAGLLPIERVVPLVEGDPVHLRGLAGFVRVEGIRQSPRPGATGEMGRVARLRAGSRCSDDHRASVQRDACRRPVPGRMADLEP